MQRQRTDLSWYFSLVGLHLLWAPLGFTWYYGNLFPYIESYLIFGCASNCIDGDVQWIISLYGVGLSLGTAFTAPLKKVLGLKFSGIICMIGGCMALFCMAYTLQYTVIGTAALVGIVIGPCSGATIGISFAYIHMFFPGHTSLFTATISGFSAALAFLENEVILHYVNPDNLGPDVFVGEKTFFSQPELLERVPSIIMILAAITFGCQATGYLLIANPKPTLDSHDTRSDSVTSETIDINGSTHIQTDYGSSETTSHDDDFVPSAEDEKFTDVPKPIKSFPGTPDQELGNSTLNTDHTVLGEEKPGVKIQDAMLRSWTLGECLKNKQFWAIYFFSGALGYDLSILNNYYKAFGLIYIPDDSFLTVVGSIMPLFSCAGRVVFGYLMHKHYLTIQDTAVASLASIGLVVTVWYFSAQIDQYLYMLIVWTFNFFHSLYYIVIPEAALKMYGPTYFHFNLSFLLSSGVPLGFLSGLVVTDIINDLGWFWLFATTAMFNIMVLFPVAIFSFNINKQHSN